MSDEQKRREPFVGFVDMQWDTQWPWIMHRSVANERAGWTPVVVTPLLPDDPRPGETWRNVAASNKQVAIISAPFEHREGRCIAYRYPHGEYGEYGFGPIRNLRRLPKLKTYEITGDVLVRDKARPVFVEAESIDDALAKIRASLTEVPS